LTAIGICVWEEETKTGCGGIYSTGESPRKYIILAFL